MINKRRLISTFKELVRIDSPPLKERGAFNYVKKQLRAMGIASREAGRPRGGEVGSLIAYLPGKGSNRHCIMLNAHIDTVAPGTNIRPIIRDGYIQTDGSTILGADNKAGVAAILEVVRSIKQAKIDHPPLLLIFTVAEEIGLVGAKVLPDQVMKADFGLTLDGGDIDTVINQAPSQYSLSARIIGKAAHAGIHPEQGVNAIKVASEAITKMRLGRLDGETTANIGVISGGTATNIVPEEVELKGEARSHDPKKLDRQVAHMEKTLLSACHKHKARVKLKVERVYRSFLINPRSRLMELVLSGMENNGIKPVVKKTGGGSDANIFNEWGIPTLILGVGADHVHTNRERIKIADLVAGTQTVLNILKEAVAWTNSKKKR